MGFGLKPRDVPPGGGVSGPRYAGARARVGQRSSLALAKKKLFALNHFFCGLTPELSRAARDAAEAESGECEEATTTPRSGVGLNELLGRRPKPDL